MSIKLISTHGETTTVNAFKLTGADAFRYSLKSNGLLSGLIAFFLGRKVRLAEARDNANIPSSIRKTMSTLLKDRNIEPLEPEIKTSNAEPLSKEEANVQPRASTNRIQSQENKAEEAEKRYDVYMEIQENITSARQAKKVLENENKDILEKIHRREEAQYADESSSQLARKQDLQEAINTERKKKDELISTLSRNMSERLRDNNPAIVDLNNQKRSAKLGEKFSDIYSNEWLDLFLALDPSQKHSNNRKNCILILNVFRTVHDEMKSLITLTLDQKAKEYGSADFHSLDMKLRDNIIGTVTAEYDKKALEIEEKLLNKVKEIVLKDIAMTDAIHECLVSYIKACSFVTYFSSISQPPLHFTYKEEGDALDEKELKEYTTQGPIIDYMVWPILLLYKDGPIVSKGAAQAKPPSDKKT